MELLTREQVNKIAKENSADHILEEILNTIRKHAESGEFECKIRGFGFGNYYGSEDDYPERNKKVIQKLRDLGYTVEIGYESRQFVDIYLYITWGD